MTTTLTAAPDRATWAAHTADMCSGLPCPVHAPSHHRMSSWPLVSPAGPTPVFERLCRHGVAHPDPDSIEQATTIDPTREGEHGLHTCCGCCTES